MSPAQAELEERDVEIERLNEELRRCRVALTEALGACDQAGHAVAGLRAELATSKAETEGAYAEVALLAFAVPQRQISAQALEVRIAKLRGIDGQEIGCRAGELVRVLEELLALRNVTGRLAKLGGATT